MSSTEQATSSNYKLIIDALTSYAKLTGIDLPNSPSAERLSRSSSPRAILELLEEREKEFKEYRSRNQRLIGRIRPAVEILYAFSGTLGGVVDLVGKHPLWFQQFFIITLLRSPSHQRRPSLSGLMLSSPYVPLILFKQFNCDACIPGFLWNHVEL